MLVVEPSSVYENPRANYSGTKRAAAVPSGRAVNPRLEHEQPSDPVTGLGRRKVPASTQRPTRGANVPVVYPRLVHRENVGAAPLIIEVGDIVMSDSFSTCFGTGTARLSRAATWREVNAELARPENRLPRVDAANPDLQLVKRMADSRHKVTMAREHVLQQNFDDYAILSDARYRQQMPSDFGSYGRRSRVMYETSRAIYDESLRVLQGNHLPLRAYPEEDLFAVPALLRWSVDGVLQSTEMAKSIVDDVCPSRSDSELLMNVAVQGACLLRNERLAKRPQVALLKHDLQASLRVQNRCV